MYNFKRCSPRGERQDSPRSRGHSPVISIHAPRVGSDPSPRSAWAGETRFQSTLPVWGATKATTPEAKLLAFQSTLPVWGATLSTRRSYENQTISIHAPRVGSDPAITGTGTSPLYFNPRSPCGERLPEHMIDAAGVVFQSTLPVWGATISLGYMLIVIRISIHAPRVGSDDNSLCSTVQCKEISIHAPRVGSDNEDVTK